VVSFVTYKVCCREAVRAVCPRIKIITIDVEIPTLIERNAVRMDRAFGAMGVTRE